VIQINLASESTYVYHSKYIKDILKKFEMAECKPAKTHMHLTCILEKEEISQKVCQKLYRGMIGSLLYLIVTRL
jgi:hypothetical protein